MKLKDGFLLSEVAGETLVVPFGERAKEFHGVIRLNPTAADIWRGIENGKSMEEIAKEMTENYANLTIDHAKQSVENLIRTLQEKGLLESL